MRFLALMLLLIGGASAGAAWHQGYGWEDLRCSIEENRWGCADTVSVTRAPRSPERGSAPTPLTDRTSCEEVRGTEYRSPTERKWFLANCVTPAAPVVEEKLPSLIDDLPPYDLPPLCDDYNDTEHWTGAELDEFM